MEETTKRKALGRGLAALLPIPTTLDAQKTLPFTSIVPSRTQPRKNFDEAGLEELAESIRSRGVLQPIIVRRAMRGYEIVAGERRFRAAQKAGLKDIPVVIKDLTAGDAFQVALIENIQRQDLDPLEEAAAFLRLSEEFDLNQEAIAKAVGKSRAAVTNRLRLLKLPPPVLTLLAEGKLTAGHARALMTLEKADDMLHLARSLIQRSATVRAAEQEARALNQKLHTPVKTKRSTNEIAIEEKLQRGLGTRIKLKQRRGKGRIEIYFHSLEQLDGLVEQLIKTA